jgi:two-component system OmpR family response regulator
MSTFVAPTVGICEDDAELRSVLGRALRAEGFDVVAVASGREAVERFAATTRGSGGSGDGTAPDLLVLDIGLPDADGRDVCQALRTQGVGAPVIFLTARGALTDRLSGFHAGGDDYLVKPFALAELLVRVRALLRRAEAQPATSATTGLQLDPAAHGVRVQDRSEALTPTEFRLLAALAARPGEVVRRHELVSAAWPDGAIVHDNTLDTYIGRLRRKLRAIGASEAISTARGVGYVLR